MRITKTDYIEYNFQMIEGNLEIMATHLIHPFGVKTYQVGQCKCVLGPNKAFLYEINTSY